jgi:hypothetical protein
MQVSKENGDVDCEERSGERGVVTMKSVAHDIWTAITNRGVPRAAPASRYEHGNAPELLQPGPAIIGQ